MVSDYTKKGSEIVQEWEGDQTLEDIWQEEEKELTIRYDDEFKAMVVHAYVQGSSITFLRKKYDIGGSTTIPRWVKKAGEKLRPAYLTRTAPADWRHKTTWKKDSQKKY